MTVLNMEFTTSSDAPYPKGSVCATARDSSEVWTEGDRCYFTLVSYKRFDVTTRVCFPQMNSAINTTPSDDATVRTKSNFVDRSHFSFQYEGQISVVCIPNMDVSISTATCNSVPIRTKENTIHFTSVYMEFLLCLFRFYLSYHDVPKDITTCEYRFIRVYINCLI